MSSLKLATQLSKQEMRRRLACTSCWKEMLSPPKSLREALKLKKFTPTRQVTTSESLLSSETNQELPTSSPKQHAHV